MAACIGSLLPIERNFTIVSFLIRETDQFNILESFILDIVFIHALIHIIYSIYTAVI